MTTELHTLVQRENRGICTEVTRRCSKPPNFNLSELKPVHVNSIVLLQLVPTGPKLLPSQRRGC